MGVGAANASADAYAGEAALEFEAGKLVPHPAGY